nr:hypothetical protein [Actinophytocola xinjiangensis]
MAQRHIIDIDIDIDIDEDLILTLLVPHLPTGTAGIDQHGANRALGPRNTPPMRVPSPIMSQRRRNIVTGKRLSDRENAPPGHVLPPRWSARPSPSEPGS